MGNAATILKSALGAILDFALPPRCAGCGEIIGEVHSFCGECWSSLDFLGSCGCDACGLPLQATEADTCARCLASPPVIARSRAAVAYDEIPRSIALRLKYGRKVALAKTMARFMAPLHEDLPDDAILAPVPLHPRRTWSRGFNQSALVANEMSRRLGVRSDPGLLRRIKSTPPLKGMSLAMRRRTVAGAFKVAAGTELRGRTIVLVDDVMTTGSTSEACARALLKAGASEVNLVSWARVIRPSQLA